jgi:cytochrome c556
MARMMGMDAIASASKTLGSMARGRIDFNAEDAAAAKASLIEHATAIPLVFADPASDPKSEALPVIWERFDDFSAKAETLRAAAEALDVTSAASIADGMGAVGGTCRSCHSTYRQ